MLASNLNISLGLPGDIVFVNVDGDFCLTYNFSRGEAEKISNISKEDEKQETNMVEEEREEAHLALSPTASLSSLSVRDHREITKLAELSNKKTAKDVSRASSKVSAYIDKVLASIKDGKVNVLGMIGKMQWLMATKCPPRLCQRATSQ